VIHVHYSNRTEDLLSALVRNLRRESVASAKPFGAAFDPVHLVVPNRNVETYVKLGLAQALGIAANLEVSFLRALLARVAEAAVPGSRVVDLLQVEGHLLTLLHDEGFLKGPLLNPVQEYLLAAGPAPAAVDRRRCQLAAEVAKLFDEYTGSRPELLASWTAGRSVYAEAPVARDIETWQAELWRGVFGEGGLVAQRSLREGVTWRPLADLLAEAQGRLPGSERALHVFGVSYMARGYHRMLAMLGRTFEVRVYTLNPCREFWEDLETVGEARRRLKKERRPLFPPRQEARQLALGQDPLGLAEEGENLALRLWGRPGRENVRLLNQLTDGDFEGRFTPAASDSLLARLQNDVLDRVARQAPDPALRADGSLSVLRCPGLRRELEVVAAEIWRLIQTEPTLRFNDIAVVVPEASKDAYLPQVGAVFAEALDLPHNVADLPLSGGHRLGEAAELLLALPNGSFTRRELLPLLIHPSVIGRFPEASAGHWVRLCAELGIVHGVDRRDHAGTYIERDLYNWDQGLRRLVLGVAMTGRRAGDESAVEMDGQAYLPADLPDGDASALCFALLVRSLLADARFATGGDGAPRLRPLPEWLEFMRGLLTSYLVPAGDDEEALLGRCLRALEELELVEIAAPVSYQVAADLARRALERLGSARGQYLARGVTVASFVPMRAIPFRVVFVLGLGHGLYPAAPRRGALDLREVRRSPGDVSPREQDLYLFLETLLCARERLVLSYVARDELTGEALPPSSVLLELRELLAEGYLGEVELKKLFEAEPPPLRRYDDTTRLQAAPLARSEHDAKRLGESLRAALPEGAALPDLRALARSLPAEVRAPLDVRLSRHLPPPAPPNEPEHLQVALSAIRQFLEDPLQGSARFRLHLREVEGEELLLEQEEEPFESGALVRTELLRETIIEALLSAPGVPDWLAVLDSYQRIGLREELAGRLPTGLFQDAARAAHEAVLKGWWSQLGALAGSRTFRREVTRFGHAGRGALGGAAHWLGRDGVARVCPPLRFELPRPARPLVVEVVGRTELVLSPAGQGVPGSVAFSCRRTAEQKDLERLRGFVDHIALSAAGLSGGRHEAITIWSNGRESQPASSTFRPVSAERARQYLETIITAMVTGTLDGAGRPTGVHDYLLPFDAVMLADKNGRPVDDEVRRMRDLYFERGIGFSSVRGPVPEAAERHEPPEPELAERMMAERFGLYFELLEGRNT
jgi:exodeoxyribonuclease V gamma subunit